MKTGRLSFNAIPSPSMDLERLEKLPSAETLKKILASPAPSLGEGIHALILDTNVLLDLLYWKDAKVAGLLPKIAKENALILFDEETLFEFTDVIAREHFALTVKEQENLLREASTLGRIVEVPPVTAPVRCKDTDDQKFLNLAYCYKGTLLTRDKRVLKCEKKLRRHGVRVMRPEELLLS